MQRFHNMYSIDRTTSVSFNIFTVWHRHCVFTFSRKLLPLFLYDRSLLSCLFSAVNSVVTHVFHKDKKAELFTPGFIYILLTLARDLKCPHIHSLLSKGGDGNSLCWRHKKHFNYKLLHNSFQKLKASILPSQAYSFACKVSDTKWIRLSNHTSTFIVASKKKLLLQRLLQALLQ